MEEMIEMKEIEFEANIFFDRIVNLFSESKNKLEPNLNTGQIIKNIHSYSDNSFKLLSIIEYRKLIYKYCSDFFNKYKFYDSYFCHLYAYSYLPKLENFINSNKLNISLNINYFKDNILYSIIENNIGGFFGTQNFYLDTTYYEYIKSLSEEKNKILTKFDNILIAFPDNINLLKDEEKRTILIENKNIYEEYKKVRKLVEFYVSQLFYDYIKYKYNLKDFNIKNQNLINDEVLDEETKSKIIDIFKDYIEIDSLKDFEKLLMKKNTNRIFFNTTNANVTFILLTLIENNIIDYPDFKDKIFINKISKKDKIFDGYSKYRDKLLNQPNDTNRIEKKLFSKVINFPFLNTNLLATLRNKIKK